MEQENADGKIEGKPQKQPQSTWFQFWKLVTIVFVFHLIPVGYIFWASMTFDEGVMGWLLFLIIDFPLGWLIVPVESMLFEYLSVRSAVVPDILQWTFFPAIFFQIVGTINWVIFVLCLRWLARLSFRSCCRHKTK